MKNHRIISFLVAGAVLGGLFPAKASAELVKRNMYVNSAGKTVSQYVYQGGRTRSSSRSSGLYRYGYGYGYGYRPVYHWGSYLHVRPHYYHHGHSRPVHRHGHGHVHGSFSGGRVHVKVRF